MIKGLSTAGIGNFGHIEDFISTASRYGFGAIDAGGDQLDNWIQEKGLEHARAFLHEHRVVIGAFGLSVEWRQDEAAFRSGLAGLAREAEAAAALGCTSCVTYVLPSTDYPAAHFMALATRRLRTCAQILAPHGIRLGLEFVGPHHLRTAWTNPFLWNMADTLDWIDAIGERNVGLLLDAYHWYTTGGTAADLLALRTEQIVHVHINDAPGVPVEEVLDNGRLYPGEGVIDLAVFLRSLHTIGYQGAVTQEILTQKASDQPQDELLRRSAEGFRKVYEAAGLVG
jgi:sugar phosphate isomerase/epimerase